MINISKSSKNLIIVSFIFSGMVFWLGSRYLSDALSHFSSSVILQRSVAPENALFEISKNLDLQRSAVQKFLIESTQFDEGRETLSNLSRQTKNLFSQIRTEVLLSQPEDASRLYRRHGHESIKALFDIMDDKFKRMSITSSVLVRQAYLPLTARDEGIRMKLFDAHTSLINSINEIRTANHGLPDKDYIDVLTAHDKKNVIWELSESINQSSALLEGYLLKIKNESAGSLNKGNLNLRLLQQHERASQALIDLLKMVQRKEDDQLSRDIVSELNYQYHDIFRFELEDILAVPASDIEAVSALDSWLDISAQTKSQTGLLVEAALNNTVATAQSIRGRAKIDLLCSLLIVLFCIIMGYATFKIARRVQHQADYDELTDMPNRRYFHDALEALLKATNISRGEKLVLITLDLNGFKAINDTLGHVAGDHLLRQVGHRLQDAAVEDMIIARMGGDEFAITYKLSGSGDPYQFACQLRDTFSRSFTIEDSMAEIDTSIGYSIYPDDANSVTELLKTSDFAMYSAKQSGKKKIAPFDRNISDLFKKRVTIEKDLPHAIENNELELYYQPQISLARGEVYSVEALVRWNHPQKGFILPVEFVSVAEETGIMPALGKWVLNEACRQAACWNNTDSLAIRVAVNVSVHQLTQSDFVESVLSVVERYNLPTGCLELEITESVVMSDIEWIVDSLNTLKNHGIRIALDDFGTGYSSLNQLQALPLDTLKIDRSFISKIDDDSINMKPITATIASIAEIYGLETVAEGIETEQQLTEVRGLGIDVAQGYYYSQPVSGTEITSVIAAIDRWAADTPKKAA